MGDADEEPAFPAVKHNISPTVDVLAPPRLWVELDVHVSDPLCPLPK